MLPLVFLLLTLCFACLLGGSWKVTKRSVNTGYYQGAINDPNASYICGHHFMKNESYVFKSPDLGKTLTVVDESQSLKKTACQSLNAQEAVTITQDGNGEFTTNGGKTWSSCSNNPGPTRVLRRSRSPYTLYGMPVNDYDKLNFGVKISNNSGLSWMYYQVNNGSIWDIALPTDKVWFIVGGKSNGSIYGDIWKTTNGGLTFSRVFYSSDKFYMTSIDCYNDNTCYATGQGMLSEGSMQPGTRVYATFDGGNNWNEVYFNNIDNSRLYAVKCISSSEVWIGGGVHWELDIKDNPDPDFGGFFHTTDSGNVWTGIEVDHIIYYLDMTEDGLYGIATTIDWDFQRGQIYGFE